MKLVKCIKEKWNFTDSMRVAISKGAKVPKIGETFVVSGSASKINGYIGYHLEEIDWSKFGFDICWNVYNFQTIEENYVPNHYDTDNNIGLCETTNISFEIKNSNLEEGVWTHNDEE